MTKARTLHDHENKIDLILPDLAPRVGDITFSDSEKYLSSHRKVNKRKHKKGTPLDQKKVHSLAEFLTSKEQEGQKSDRINYFMKFIDNAEFDPQSIHPKDLSWFGYKNIKEVQLPKEIVDKVDVKSFNDLQMNNINKRVESQRVRNILISQFGTDNVTEILSRFWIVVHELCVMEVYN